ncbi:hypothetical protein FPQ18DRAFT_392762 [Pyronema domesticum]|nr:hypothetical protein FPQ18DRAFT_392762 [Pyronema domesticum]
MPTPDYSIFYRCVATRRRVTPQNSSHQHSSRRYHIYTTIHYGRVRTASSWVNYVQMNFMPGLVNEPTTTTNAPTRAVSAWLLTLGGTWVYHEEVSVLKYGDTCWYARKITCSYQEQVFLAPAVVALP